ncbi:MAG TPA: PIN domain-containing protein [Thermoleophilia bacterium]|nr:PIN domain-containing protein [Thermoleophilia bacterium]
MRGVVALVRLLLTIVGGVAGYEASNLGLSYASLSGTYSLLLLALGVVVGVGIGFILGGVLGRQVLRLGSWVDRVTVRVSAAALIVTSIGLVLGLGIAALASLAVKDLPVVGVFLLPVIYAVCGYVFASLAYSRHSDIGRVVGFKNLGSPDSAGGHMPKILDTSVIIDARIGDIVPTYFLEGDLIIPGFVLEELQSIADSSDPLRRARGRRGLECVSYLQTQHERVVIADQDFPGLAEVDMKLIKMAKEMGAAILTTDYNLNKIAQIQGVVVLNVNELANALKPVVLPGESLAVRVIREGKEEDQGVAYLDDGTMVVVEGGRKKVGQTIEVEVTSVLQNPSGKMVFTKLAS